LSVDLETNAREQAEVRSQVAALQAVEARLKEEQAWLSSLQSKIAGETTTAEEQPPEAQQAADSRGDDAENAAVQPAAAETVPQPRRAKKAPEPRKTRRKTAQAEPEGATKAAKATKKAQPAAKKDEPPLRVVILEALTQHHEPRLVREIAQEVKQAHPDRDPSDQVVRNSLNTLIAKGQVERQEQGNSVLYTAVRTAEEDSKAVPEQTSASADPVLADA
jgi:hypothetical protein